MDMNAPLARPLRIFISYSHDSPSHQDRVLILCDLLREHGLDAWLDQYEPGPPEGWPRWMEAQIESADLVLVVCTEIYLRRFRGIEEPGRGLGANWEGAIVTQALYDAAARNKKFIPVLFSREDESSVPIVLRGVNRYRVDQEEGYEALYRYLTGQPTTPAPLIGSLRRAAPRQRPSTHIPPSKDEQLPPKTSNALRKRFVHAKVSANSLLDTDLAHNPYADSFDPTDEIVEQKSEISIYFWMPREEVLSSRQSNPLTPVAAICTLDANATKDSLKLLLGQNIGMLDRPPRAMRNEEKECAFKALSGSLRDCFVVAVAVPDLAFSLGRTRPEVSYQIMMDLFFLPLLLMHKRIGFERLRVLFGSVGSSDSTLIRLGRRYAKVCCARKDRTMLEIAREGDDSLCIRMTRLLAWAVQHYYNSNDRRWMQLLEESLA